NTAALAGDYNRNNIVDTADVLIWRRMDGQTVAPFSGADGDGDGVVGQADYDLWRTNYGMELAPGSGSALAAATAPESSPAASAGSAAARVKTPAKSPSVATSSASASDSAGAGAGAFAAADAAGGRSSTARHRPVARPQLTTSPDPNDVALVDWAITRSIGRRDRAQPSEAWTNEESDESVTQDLGVVDSAFESFEAIAS
ncbi:MAG TPA: hypothetical protein VJ828_01640, partial [Lacipirellulaceae bacterium]|nr:hypothetical protein [Lacipirellulaceae bacterium]